MKWKVIKWNETKQDFNEDHAILIWSLSLPHGISWFLSETSFFSSFYFVIMFFIFFSREYIFHFLLVVQCLQKISFQSRFCKRSFMLLFSSFIHTIVTNILKKKIYIKKKNIHSRHSSVATIDRTNERKVEEEKKSKISWNDCLFFVYSSFANSRNEIENNNYYERTIVKRYNAT